MSDTRTRLPEADNADPDGVQVALRAAHTLWSHGDTAESLRWLSRAAESASDEGADLRSLQLAKAAAELRAQLFGRPAPAVDPVPMQSSAPPPASPPGPPPSARASATAQRSESSQYSEPRYGDSQYSEPPQYSEPRYADSQDAEPRYADPQYSESQYSDHAVSARAPREGRDEPAPPLGAVVTATQYPAARARGDVRPSLAVPPREVGGRSAKHELSSTMMGVGFGYEEDDVEAEALPDDADMEEDEGVSESWLVSRERATTQPSPAHPTTMTGPSPLAGAGMLAPPPLPQAAATPRSMVPQSAPAQSAPSSRAVSQPPASPSAPPGSMAPSGTPVSVSPPPASAGQPGAGSAPEQQSPLARTLELGAMSPFLARSGPVASRPPAGESPSNLPPSAHLSSRVESGVPSSPTVPSGPQPVGERERPSEPESTGTPASRQEKLRARVHHQAVRVSVAPHAHADGQYVFRLLREGEVPASGERVALLVALEPGSPLV